ncbi:MAG: ABC transporter permease subunit [Thaumarchaeota archaeon]|nr:ABC transporter permease subunit [Nitrososphaerota archaeon]
MQFEETSTLILPFLAVLFPIGIASGIAMDSFVGERTRRTIEPILATPITERALFVAKVLASFLPAMIVSYCTLIAYSLLIATAKASNLTVVFSPASLSIIFWQAPAIALVGTCIMIIASAKIRDPRAAMQIGNVIMLGVLFGFFYIFSSYMSEFEITILVNSLLTVSALVLLLMGNKSFTREEILSRI